MRRVPLDIVFDKIAAVREVTVTMHYAVYEHDDIISPNTLTFPPITDTLDKESCKGLRALWLNAVREKKAEPSAAVPEAGKNESPMQRIFAELKKSLCDQMLESFIRSAAYPVPSSYLIKLPVRSSMREEIISNLVPFDRTREMLLRLESDLESPMRLLEIGHVPADNIAIMRASMPNAKTVVFN